MENSLTVERSSFKMSFLSFTLIYYFTGPGIVQRVPCTSEHLQVSFGVFLNTMKPVSWYLYISDKLYPTTKNTSRVSTLWLLHLHISDSYFICRKDFKRIKLVNRRQGLVSPIQCLTKDEIWSKFPHVFLSCSFK